MTRLAQIAIALVVVSFAYPIVHDTFASVANAFAVLN